MTPEIAPWDVHSKLASAFSNRYRHAMRASVRLSLCRCSQGLISQLSGATTATGTASPRLLTPLTTPRACEATTAALRELIYPSSEDSSHSSANDVLFSQDAAMLLARASAGVLPTQNPLHFPVSVVTGSSRPDILSGLQASIVSMCPSSNCHVIVERSAVRVQCQAVLLRTAR